ncbi:nuclear transport factor 2 family protein [Geodermatophilus amargosae]|uniref:nuclear transport factor 2 family protein n=1 Tax=Geodermatophilus amargosae TaxID=1296565 RepID=UPI0034DF2EC5
MSLEDDNKQLVERFMQVFSAGDVEAILGSMTEDATWWVAGSMPGISGEVDREGFGEMLRGLSALTKAGAISLTPLAWTCQGNRVAVETESYAELLNGRVYNNLYHFVFEVRGDKIASIKEYLDTEHTTAVFLAP